MGEHVRVLGMLGVLRALVGIAFGSWLLWKAAHLDFADYGLPFPGLDTMTFDRQAFRILGGLALGVAPFRALQGILALARRRAARPLGMGLAVLDLVNLIIFPVSTALGLYGIVVYHHPDTVRYLGGGRASVTPG